jgi:hypothetical protein
VTLLYRVCHCLEGILWLATGESYSCSSSEPVSAQPPFLFLYVNEFDDGRTAAALTLYDEASGLSVSGYGFTRIAKASSRRNSVPAAADPISNPAFAPENGYGFSRTVISKASWALSPCVAERGNSEGCPKENRHTISEDRDR